MSNEEMKIKCQTFAQAEDTEVFEVTWSPNNNTNHETKSNCDYESVLDLANKTLPTLIVIDPEDMNSVTLVRFLHDLLEKYDPSTRIVQRGGEFVEKYSYYELILQLKTII